MKTVIIGGGIAGLAAAICLNQAGMDVVVCERATEYSNAGLSFILLPNGLAALDQLGFGPQVRALGHPINRAVMRFADGSSIKDTPLEESLCITRYNFVKLLYNALPANLVVTGKRFSHFTRRADGTVTPPPALTMARLRRATCLLAPTACARWCAAPSFPTISSRRCGSRSWSV